jgi:outer membrane immunogenic protein
MKKIAQFLIPLMCVAGVAHAADGASDTLRWNGFYGGAHVISARLSGGMDAYTPYNSYDGFALYGMNKSGTLAGLQLGYNHQLGDLVIGVEGSLSFGDIKKESRDNEPGTLFWRKTNFIATIAPRLGYAYGNFLAYGKVGLAVANFEVGHDQNGTNLTSKDNRAGYLVGLGGEYAFSPRMSVSLGYDYMNFGRGKALLTSPSGTNLFMTQGGNISAVKLALNYKF